MSDPVALHAPFAGWFSTLDEVADPVFAGRMMGDGCAIDPLEGIVRAPADGEVVSVPATAHAVTLRLANGAELLLHVGLDTVALNGAGFTASVRAGDRVRRGDPLLIVDLDTVARGAPDCVTPMVLPGDNVAVTLVGGARLVAAGELIAHVTASADTPADAAEGPALSRPLRVRAPHGLHARPAARIVALLKPYAAQVVLRRGDRHANARSTVALLALGAGHDDTLVAEARGEDAAAALDALASFAEERFGDDTAADTVDEAPLPRDGGGGVCASPGLAIGQIFQFRPGAVVVTEEARGAAWERDALAGALEAVGTQLGGQGVAAGIAEAHRALLDDPQLHGAAVAGIADGLSAGSAWRAATDAAAEALMATGDARLIERVADLRDIERQLLVALGGTEEAPAVLPPDAILVAPDLLPSQFLALDRSRLAGVCTAAGGPTAHVAILAAAAGIPMLVAAGPAILSIADGETAILDADAALLTPGPDAPALAAASARRAAVRERRTEEYRLAQTSAATADGTRIEVFANLGSIAEAALAVRAGAEGCGLLRTEFLFLDRDGAPGEDEQAACYRAVAAALGDRPLIVRTLDIGGDKPVPYLPRAAEDNPALGVRGVRLSLVRPDLLAMQMRAILAAVPAPQCRIMLPMVVDVAELRAARHLLEQAMAATGRTGHVPLGVMVETPAAALLADQLAAHADFLSVGTNDLTQYALAADRGNAGVSAMVDALHPAVLRLIARTVSGARRHGRWVGVCGGLASDPRAAALLVGLGVTELSAVASAIPAVKAAVRRTALADARVLAERALDAISPNEVRALLGDGE